MKVSVFATLLFVFGAPFLLGETSSDGTFTYTYEVINSGAEARLTNVTFSDTALPTELSIPETLGGLPVTEIELQCIGHVTNETASEGKVQLPAWWSITKVTFPASFQRIHTPTSFTSSYSGLTNEPFFRLTFYNHNYLEDGELYNFCHDELTIVFQGPPPEGFYGYNWRDEDEQGAYYYATFTFPTSGTYARAWQKVINVEASAGSEQIMIFDDGDTQTYRTSGQYYAWRNMAIDRTVSGAYVIPSSVSLSVTAGAGGSVSSSPSGASFAPGTSVTLTATPDEGYAFVGWTGDDLEGTEASTSLTMVLAANSTEITASFEEIPTVTLTVQASPAEGGSVSGTALGQLDPGTSTQLTAVANEGYLFSHWSWGRIRPQTIRFRLR